MLISKQNTNADHHETGNSREAAPRNANPTAADWFLTLQPTVARPAPPITWSAEQLFNTADQALDGERLNQILYFVPVEKEGDVRIGCETGDKDKPVCDAWAHRGCLEVKFVSTHERHFHVADDDVVLVDLNLEKRFLTVKSDINEKLLVRQDPL